MTLFLKIVGGVALIYITLAVLLVLFQRKLVFVPDSARILPSEAGLVGVDEVVLTSSDGHKLYCWYGKAKPLKPTFLMYHGNGGNIADRERKFRFLMEQGYGVFMLGYRGYGGSEGSPSEEAFVRDATLSYDHLISTGLARDDIVIYGESIGTSVAVQVAAKHKARALILEAPMNSVTAVAEERYPIFMVRPFLWDRFESDRFIKNISMPLLVLHGDQDRVIPIELGRRLFDLAPEPKKFVSVPGGHHTDLYDYPIVDEMVRFLDAHQPER